MSKNVFVLKSMMVFTVNDGTTENNDNLKEAMENGDVEISMFNVELFNPDGSKHTNGNDIDVIKQSIIYGIKEKG